MAPILQKEEKYNKIVALFLQSLSDRQVTMREAYTGLGDGGGHNIVQIRAHIETIRIASHNLVGTAGSLGFDHLSKLARNLETKSTSLLDSDSVSSDAQLAKFSIMFCALESEIQRLMELQSDI